MKLMTILQAARARGASDVHLVSGLPPAFRVNGEIVMNSTTPFNRDTLRALVDELLNVVMYKIYLEVLNAQENRNGDSFVLHADVTCLSRLGAFATAEGKPLKPKMALWKKQLADWSGKLGKKDREVYVKLISQLY